MRLCMAPLFSSSSGNSTYIGTEKTGLLVDAGLAGSNICDALKSIDAITPSAILITHEHTDHIKGAGVISRKFDIPIYANAETWEQMEPKIGAVAQKNIRVIDTESEFFIGDICAKPIPLSHDAANPVGYSFFGGGKKVCTMTDTGKLTKNMLDAAAGSSIVLLESNHDIEMLKCGKYPYKLKMRILSGKGHLSNNDAGKGAIDLAKRGVRGILLGHLSRENNFEELAYSTVRDTLEASGVRVGKDIALAMTHKFRVTGRFDL